MHCLYKMLNKLPGLSQQAWALLSRGVTRHFLSMSLSARLPVTCSQKSVLILNTTSLKALTSTIKSKYAMRAVAAMIWPQMLLFLLKQVLSNLSSVAHNNWKASLTESLASDSLPTESLEEYNFRRSIYNTQTIVTDTFNGVLGLSAPSIDSLKLSWHLKVVTNNLFQFCSIASLRVSWIGLCKNIVMMTIVLSFSTLMPLPPQVSIATTSVKTIPRAHLPWTLTPCQWFKHNPLGPLLWQPKWNRTTAILNQRSWRLLSMRFGAPLLSQSKSSSSTQSHLKRSATILQAYWILAALLMTINFSLTNSQLLTMSGSLRSQINWALMILAQSSLLTRDIPSIRRTRKRKVTLTWSYVRFTSLIMSLRKDRSWKNLSAQLNLTNLPTKSFLIHSLRLLMHLAAPWMLKFLSTVRHRSMRW